MSTPKSITIIGNGAAGTTAAIEIRKRDKDIPVEIISREDTYGYNRPMLTKSIVSGVDEKVFFLKPKEWYKENHVDVKLDCEVDSIDVDIKTINLKDGQIEDYDTLILATGAEAFVPPFPGKDLDGVFSIRHWKDIKSIKERLDKSTDAVVIGGGILGLEAAWDINKAVDNVTVIEQSNAMMFKQLDSVGSEALKKAADEAGINIKFKSNVEELIGENGSVTGVKLKGDGIIPAQLVIISTGIKQNIDLVVDKGAEVTKSIVVNDRMQTGIPDVYAIGDCAEYKGINYGIWPQAVDMAKTAVANIFGEDHPYKQTIPANMMKLSNMTLYAIGDNGKNSELPYELYEKSNPDQGKYERYYFVDNKLVGGTLIGDISKLSKLLEAYNNRTDKETFIKEIEG